MGTEIDVPTYDVDIDLRAINILYNILY